MTRPPIPPFDLASATLKVRSAEDAWNTRDPVKVSEAYTPDSGWRNRSEFLAGRPAIVAFLQRKWVRELDYRLIKELWAFGVNRICGEVCLRMARRPTAVVSLARQRKLAVRPRGLHGAASREY